MMEIGSNATISEKNTARRGRNRAVYARETVSDAQRPRAGQFRHAGREYAYLSYVPRGLARPARLTDAKAHVAELVLRGASGAEIARARGVSPRTIANQLASIYRKLGVCTRAELVLALQR